MMNLKVFIGIASLFILLLMPENALACSCGGGGEPCQAYGSAAAVFVGTVTVIKDAPPLEREEWRRRVDAGERYWPRRVKFAVEQSFLIGLGPEAEIGTGHGGGDCGYEFKEGEKYLVYAYDYNKRNDLSTSICTRTKPFAEADKDLEFLRSLPVQAPGVTISGMVRHQLWNPHDGNAKSATRMADAVLVIEGGGVREELRTDAEGRYRASGLRPGTYKVTLQLPDELMTHNPMAEVSVADRGCAFVDYYVRDNGRLSGRVYDANGNPAARVELSLVPADSADVERPESEKHHSYRNRTNNEGHYSYKGLPAGRYLLAVNLSRFPEYDSPSHAYPRTFHPGVAHAREAEVITIGTGENVRDIDLRLPSPRAASVLEVSVVWEDGSPVVKAEISFKDVTYHEGSNHYGTTADEYGRFTLKGYAGQVFTIEVRNSRASCREPNCREPSGRAEPLRVTLAEPLARARIVMKKLTQ